MKVIHQVSGLSDLTALWADTFLILVLFSPRLFFNFHFIRHSMFLMDRWKGVKLNVNKGEDMIAT